MAYYDAAFQFGRRLLRGFSEALGLQPDYLDSYVDQAAVAVAADPLSLLC